jgi:peptidoglycan L-alanyl-D-glutamate endopeptidase CwlK
MPQLGRRSRQNLVGVHPDLVLVLEEAIKDGPDFCVLSGYRDEAEQNALVEHDPPRSQLRWPNSKHNHTPSLAVDVAPWPIDWSDTARFCHLMGYLERVAFEMDVELAFGMFWRRFKDYGHVEVVI